MAEAFSCRTQTVENIRQRFVLDGFGQAFDRKKREPSPTAQLLDGERAAKIIATRLGPPPKEVSCASHSA